MNIVVALRLVPDLAGDVELTEDGLDIDREWTDLKLSEFDEHALEEAILLKEAYGAKVTAVALAGDGVERMLRGALARGADEAFTLDYDGIGLGASRAAAPLYAAAVQAMAADLFLTGVLTVEDLFGQLGPYVGEELGWPHISAVTGIEAQGDRVVVKQEVGGGAVLTVSMKCPAVVSVQAASQPIRYVSGSRLREANAIEIRSLSLSYSRCIISSTLVGLNQPTTDRPSVLFKGSVADIADKLVAVFDQYGLLED